MEKNISIDITQNNKSHKKKVRKKRHNKAFVTEYTPNLPENILNISVEQLDISMETRELLIAGKVTTIKDIASRYMNDMYKIHRIGKKQCFEIRKALGKYGADYRPNEVAEELDDKISAKQLVEKISTDKQTQKADIFSKKNNNNFARERDVRLKTIHDGLERPKVEDYEPLKNSYLKFSKGGKFGLKTIDKKDLIPPEYDDIFFFSSGLAVVELDGKFGYIDENNKMRIEPKYDLALSFSEGLAVVAEYKDGHYMCGYIDENGNVIITLEYESATSFNAGVACVKKDGKWYNIDKENKLTTV